MQVKVMKFRCSEVTTEHVEQKVNDFCKSHNVVSITVTPAPIMYSTVESVMWLWYTIMYEGYPDDFDEEEPTGDQENVCPLCGHKGLNYGEREQLDCGGVIDWECPRCGATGREGYDEAFDGHHYNVCNKDGEPAEHEEV